MIAAECTRRTARKPKPQLKRSRNAEAGQGVRKAKRCPLPGIALRVPSKVTYLRHEFAVGMQHQVIGAALSGLNPQLELKISRSNLVEDVVSAVSSHSVWELRRPLKVQFVGEAGEDQGGLTNEFFELAFQHLAEPKYQLWEVSREWRTLWFRSGDVDPSKESLYQIVGILLGMCVYNSSSVALNFPSWLYSQLLGITPTLNDLKALDPTLAHSLEELLRFEGDVENTFCLTFEISVPDRSQEEIDAELIALTNAGASSPYSLQPGTPIANDRLLTPANPSSHAGSVPMLVDDGDSSSSTALVPSRPRRYKNIPLLPGGEDIYVTQENKKKYVALYLEWIFTKSVHQALRPLVEGFQSIVGRVSGGRSDTATMGLFTAADLELCVVGKKEMNFTDLKRGARYEGGYTAHHPTIVDFWSIVLHELTPKEQRQLLVFATGSSRAPIGGLAEVRLLVQRAGPDSDLLPTSSTCFHALLLPQYATKQKMKEKLQLALSNAVGFGLR
jgi:ubiquitin-protein ligase E3 A